MQRSDGHKSDDEILKGDEASDVSPMKPMQLIPSEEALDSRNHPLEQRESRVTTLPAEVTLMTMPEVNSARDLNEK